MTVERVSATEKALTEIARLEKQHGPLFFQQDVYMGEIGGQPFYMGKSQWEYWQHTHLIIDVVPGRGSGFSLEAPDGIRFLTRSRVYTEAENDELDKQGPPPNGAEMNERAAAAAS
jgi:uncharacterized protein (DUF779 family)